jgi:double-stranded uracil-DNA glycosylase
VAVGHAEATGDSVEMTLDPATAAVYEANAREWTKARVGKDVSAAARLMARDPGEGPILDIGCGPGYFLAELPQGSIGLDPTAGFLELLGDRVPEALGIRGEAGALPIRSASIGGVLANAVYQHLHRHDLPMAFADLHRVLELDAPAEIIIFSGDSDMVYTDASDSFPGRGYSFWPADRFRDVLVGAGFLIESFEDRSGDEPPLLLAGVRRSHTLPDIVGSNMKLLICGLNPSVYSADVAVGFGRPGNRFWPAAIAAGLVTLDRNPRHALANHGIGMTDLVKRATRRADELSRDEYADGVARLDRLCAWLEPEAICMVGLAGWRAAVNPKAIAGWQEETLGGRPVYVMPSTSGLNAHSGLDDLADHLRMATN